ncbi:MAG TPA: PDZ domain-containing protein [Actinomycetes bacterium]|nr:PDZ domain-containing protein [Actinomycetes bacterium]
MTRRARTVALILTFAALFVISAIAITRPVPYVRLSPGPVYNALGEDQGHPVVTVEGAKTFPTDGSLGITTVYELGAPGSQLSLFQALRGWLDPSEDVVPREFLYPDEVFDKDDAGDEFRRQGQAQMAESEQSAIVAALQYVGEPVTFQVIVTDVLPDTPADGVLEDDDTILAIDGEKVSSYRDVKQIMGDVEPGDEVSVTIRRDDERMNEQLITIENPDDPDRAFIGVLLGLTFKSPVEVDLRLDDVGGPSAGLIFSLAIVDSLTPGSLTEGRSLAGTGTITPQGRVGPIGRIVQKMFGARDDGASMFLAPRSNCDEVLGNIPDGLDVIAVRTLDGAIAALDGSGPSPECPANAKK